MKQLGYAALLLMFIIIIIPFILVRGCSQEEMPIQEEKEVGEKLYTIRVYIKEEDKVVEMNFNEYLKGVLAAEMPAAFHIEALKAQTVAARTYVYHRIRNNQRAGIEIPEHKGADICTDHTHCKAWVSKKDAMAKWGILSAQKYWDKIDRAVDDTANLIITYEDEPIDAVFHSTSSGKTENSEEVWGNSIPYLRSILSEGEEHSPKYTSTVEVSIDDFRSRLYNSRPGIQLKEDIRECIGEAEKTEGGSVKTIAIGDQSFKGTEIRKIFHLNSANFSIDVQDDKVLFYVTGYGHGVGLSQYGANYLAEQGKTYQEILKYYYKDVRVVLVEE